MKKQMKKTSSQPSPCSLASAVFSPSQAGDFLQGLDPVQAARGLSRSPLRAGLAGSTMLRTPQTPAWHPQRATSSSLPATLQPPPAATADAPREGDRATPRICSGGRAGLALHPAASPTGAPSGTGRAGGPATSRDPAATVVKAFFPLLSHLFAQKGNFKEGVRKGGSAQRFCSILSVLRIRRYGTPQPISGLGTMREVERLRFPPAQTRSLLAHCKPRKRW